MRLVPIMAALLLMLPVSTVQAAVPLGVHFDVQTTFADPSHGPFVAIGPAVDQGLMCGEGDTVDLSVKPAGEASSVGFSLQVLKQFTCADGSGSFVVKLQVRIDFDRGGSASWKVMSGTGAYERLHGAGDGYGVPADYGVNDLLFGTVH
jgi:hypothetical protein